MVMGYFLPHYTLFEPDSNAVLYPRHVLKCRVSNFSFGVGSQKGKALLAVTEECGAHVSVGS